jgi:hypothetical protein
VDVVKALVSGVVVIGLATTIGLHGGGISTAAKGAGSATQGVLGTAIKG